MSSVFFHHHNHHIYIRCSLLQESRGTFGHQILIIFSLAELKQISDPCIFLLLDQLCGTHSNEVKVAGSLVAFRHH